MRVRPSVIFLLSGWRAGTAGKAGKAGSKGRKGTPSKRAAPAKPASPIKGASPSGASPAGMAPPADAAAEDEGDAGMEPPAKPVTGFEVLDARGRKGIDMLFNMYTHNSVKDSDIPKDELFVTRPVRLVCLIVLV